MKLNGYKHIVWDWNGTLLNDMWLCVESINQTLTRRDMTLLSQQRYQQLFDFPVIDFYRRLGFDFEKESFSDLAHEYHDGYEPRWSECDLQPGALVLLRYFEKNTLSQSLLSAAHQSMLDDGVRHFQLENFFIKTMGQENNQGLGKIDKGKAWVTELTYQPYKVLLIGDTTHDYDVAAAMGIDCVLIVSGHHCREKLQTRGAPVYDSLEALMEHH
jgi:phosphoglycolate phosphatase